MKFVTVIPLTRNDGSEVEKSELQEIINEMIERFGGFTIEGTVDGGWRHEGEVYRDRSWKISCVCERSQYEEAKQMVIQIGHRLGQIEMYFEVCYFDGVQFLKIT